MSSISKSFARILERCALAAVIGVSTGAFVMPPAMAAQPEPVAVVAPFGGLTQQKLAEEFKGFDASFVMYDTKTKQYLRFNPKQCAERIAPCSTFKIFNSMAGLESGVVHDENTSMKWDGKPRPIKDHNRDQTLQSAVTYSVVWYFQRIAEGVGEKRMKEYLTKVHYGNEDMSGGLTKFWLGSSLKISADEQVEFLNRLINDDLPFSKRSMAITRGMLRIDQTPKGALYGKTGSNLEADKEVLGWFVGYIAQPDRTYIFATNIQAADGAWGPKARKMMEKLFTEIGML